MRFKTHDKIFLSILFVFFVYCIWAAFKVSESLQWSDEKFARTILEEIYFNQQQFFKEHGLYTDLDHMKLGYFAEKYDIWNLGNPKIINNEFILKNYIFKSGLSKNRKKYFVMAKEINSKSNIIYISQDSTEIPVDKNGNIIKYFYGTPEMPNN